ncbi:MAG: patatin-like phospholipase family protein [Thermodesulfobacteriota bacterium]
MKDVKIGVALGQGGARGLAHIGVLQVLQENGFPIDIISGTSIGALIGAMYSETQDTYVMQGRVEEFIASEIYQHTGFPYILKPTEREPNFWDQITSKIKGTIALNLAQTKIGLFSQERFKSGIQILLQAQTFEECKIPLVTVATDLESGHEIPFCSGNLFMAVLASAAIPGFFAPIKHRGFSLSDGAICCPVPTKYAVYDPNTVVIGVNVPPRLENPKPIENALDVMIRAENINMYYLSSNLMARADVGITPETGYVEWNEFHRYEELIQSGRDAAEAALPELEQEIAKRTSWWKRMFG